MKAFLLINMNQKLTKKQIIIGFAIGAIAIPCALFLDRAGYIRLLPKSKLEIASDEAAAGLSQVLLKEKQVACDFERRWEVKYGKKPDVAPSEKTECEQLDEMREKFRNNRY